MSKGLSKQMLIRMSEDEFEAWKALATSSELSPNNVVRRVMASACDVPNLIETVERRILEGQIERANQMRVTRDQKRRERGLTPLGQPKPRGPRARKARKAGKPRAQAAAAE